MARVKMKRNLKSILKYFIFILTTVFLTIVIFKLFKQFDQHNNNNNNNDDVQLEKVFARKQLYSNQTNKIDWHDWEFINLEKQRTGIGEQGVSVSLTSFNQHKYDELYKVNGFNGLLSDSISVNRSIPDIRHKLCRFKKYNSNLPDVSVIVPFHNEHLSTLLRTVYSVLNRSPKNLLKEIILVDDSSTKVNLKKSLDKYLSINLADRVKIIHLKKRQGLIRARLAGAKKATSEVLIFLDSHTEANVNWLPPLLEPITEDYRTCVCPFIDVIAYETFQYRAQDEGARGAFDWEFFYKRLPLLPDDLLHPTRPFRSPVMAGGLFAISAKWFWELGGYDPGLDIWGGEQYELSFKIWQCGGTILDAPCSRVGHIYRKFAPFPNPGIGDFVGKNYRRVAEVWMDEYAEYLYRRRPHYRDINTGDITKQKEIREKLKCKPFKWFMQKVAFDLVKKYPPIEPPDISNGKIRSFIAPELCLDASAANKLDLKECVDGNENQIFIITWRNDIKTQNNMCLDINDSSVKAKITLYSCHNGGGNQLWHYDHKKKVLVQGNNPRCMEHNISARKAYVTQCKPENEDQKWIIENFNTKASTWSLTY
ncbi:Nucleotide-diphospho-sugar transferases,Glycosyltransferase 2-like,Ricin B, lectin [Cinara cedri]|uniref:Polypeptide N-acetylgalactosaminyltransferase n=1 Tax=Cinara cedri TaxID=506608 RepID=A0A5E4NCV1_9HEMI|nr:Nucleotide-diphospho-sugar transferases,Glycosyltransferase 2-like,Ricin B, lectin [Cinara cedri]